MVKCDCFGPDESCENCKVLSSNEAFAALKDYEESTNAFDNWWNNLSPEEEGKIFSSDQIIKSKLDNLRNKK